MPKHRPAIRSTDGRLRPLGPCLDPEEPGEAAGTGRGSPSGIIFITGNGSRWSNAPREVAPQNALQPLEESGGERHSRVSRIFARIMSDSQAVPRARFDSWGAARAGDPHNNRIQPHRSRGTGGRPIRSCRSWSCSRCTVGMSAAASGAIQRRSARPRSGRPLTKRRQTGGRSLSGRRTRPRWLGAPAGDQAAEAIVPDARMLPELAARYRSCPQVTQHANCIPAKHVPEQPLGAQPLR